MTRKVIISHDVQFVETEVWDGSIENTVRIVNHVAHDDMIEEVVQTTHASQNVVAPSTPRIVWHVLAQATITHTSQLKLHQEVHQEHNKLQQAVQGILLFNRSNICKLAAKKNKKPMWNIWCWHNKLFFIFFIIFSNIWSSNIWEVVKNEIWAQAMDEEIECIKKNQTWELVDVPKDNDV